MKNEHTHHPPPAAQRPVARGHRTGARRPDHGAPRGGGRHPPGARLAAALRHKRLVEKLRGPLVTLTDEATADAILAEALLSRAQREQKQAELKELQANPCPGTEETSDSDFCEECSRDWRACAISRGEAA
jgi:hypothetical protein